MTEAYDLYEFHRAFKDFIDPFVANTLSATYHDVLKIVSIREPNDPPADPRRLQFTSSSLFHSLDRTTCAIHSRRGLELAQMIATLKTKRSH